MYFDNLLHYEQFCFTDIFQFVFQEPVLSPELPAFQYSSHAETTVPLGHIILIPTNQPLLFLLNAACLMGKQQTLIS
jgi:hypothetical protein